MKTSIRFLFVGLFSVFVWQVNHFAAQTSTLVLSEQPELTKQETALQVLENHCNNCHRSRQRDKVFTLENMNTFAPSIYNQVFVYKKMPRGKARRERITEEELQKLITWLAETGQNLNN